MKKISKICHKMSNLIGTWNLESTENFDEFLKSLGVGLVARKTLGAVKPTMHFSKNGDEWVFKIETAAKNREIKFKDGVQFEDGKHFFK